MDRRSRAGKVVPIPGIEDKYRRIRLHLMTRVLLDVFEEHPVLALAAGIAAGTRALESRGSVLDALGAAAEAVFAWETGREWRPGA